MLVYKILLPILINEPFDYSSNTPLQIGDIVRVPFRKSTEVGVVWDIGESEVHANKIKMVEEKLFLHPLKPSLIKFLQFVSDYNLAPVGTVLKMTLSAKFIKRTYEPKPKNVSYQQTALSAEQEKAADKLKQAVSKNEFSTFLLDGVTGSGKTEVYFEAIYQAILEGKQVLVMLPEIALSHQWLMRFEKRFGVTPTIWHSDRTEKQRREAWIDIATGNSKLVVGARSALFLPFHNLGLVVVDEEHDHSYKQEEGVIYQARDMAVARAKFEDAPAILVSATPSLESTNNVNEKKYNLLHLPERFGGAKLPQIRVIDMRREKLKSDHFLSTAITSQLEKTISAHRQAIIFLNRRGYAPLVLCRACGHRMQCPNCSSWLVLHAQGNKLNCHHCGYSKSFKNECPECHENDKLHACGPGVERISAEVKELFPTAKVEVMSSDSPKAADEIVGKMLNHEIDILVGTQMIAKGHHFPKLDFVGIVDADLGLEGGDLRAMERTYQLLHQVAGRAGREEEIGSVLVQTYNPQNIVIEAIANESRDEFIKREIQMRKSFEMPPFGRLASITVSGKNSAAVIKYAQKLSQVSPQTKGVHIFGPAPAPLSLLRGQHRYRLLIKAPRKANIQEYIKHWLAKELPPSSIRIKIDIEPYSFV